MQTVRRSLLASAAALALCTSLAAPAWAQAVDFKGKTINLVVGAGGGGIDLAARIFARHLPKYLPGEPTVVVRQMPGGATLVAQNYVFEKARPDGLTLSFNPFQIIAQLVGDQGLRFKYEDATFVAGIVEPPFLGLARLDIVPGGLKSGIDVAKAPNLVYAGRKADHVVDVLNMAAFELLGAKYKYVPGYLQSGQAEFVVALNGGEANVAGISAAQWFNNFEPMQKEKKVLTPVWAHPDVQEDGSWARSKSFPTLPMVQELYQEAYKKAPSGPLWDAYKFAVDAMSVGNFIVFAPPKTDPEVAKVLRAAFAKTIYDKDFTAEAQKALGAPYEIAPQRRALSMLEGLKTTDPKLVNFWKQRIESYTR